MRLFYIDYGSRPVIYNEKGLENCIKVAVLHNKDIANFSVTEIDSRLNVDKGFNISQRLGFPAEYIIETQNGMTPFESIVGHIDLKK